MKIEHYRYTDRYCEECKNIVVYDEHRDEHYCLKCGLIEEQRTKNNGI